ncbi:MAG TPA: hypothetical protein VGU90_10100, partial [Terriglobales bacterium]|nr:hypothetical protein [Terriglobales bacterium]
ALADARQKIASETPPPSHLLPTPPTEEYPADNLRAPGRGSWEKEVYSFKAGDFTVELVDPISEYETDNDKYQRAMKDYSKLKGRTAPIEPQHKYLPMVHIVAIPQTKTSWGKTMAVGIASNGNAPSFKHYKTGFEKMRLLCGSKEVEPIWPGKFVAGRESNYYTIVEDEALSGHYIYAQDAISPQCGKVTLQLFSTNSSDHSFEKVLDEKLVSRIWSDFEPYHKGTETGAPSADKK